MNYCVFLFVHTGSRGVWLRQLARFRFTWASRSHRIEGQLPALCSLSHLDSFQPAPAGFCLLFDFCFVLHHNTLHLTGHASTVTPVTDIPHICCYFVSCLLYYSKYFQLITIRCVHFCICHGLGAGLWQWLYLILLVITTPLTVFWFNTVLILTWLAA